MRRQPEPASRRVARTRHRPPTPTTVITNPQVGGDLFDALRSTVYGHLGANPHFARTAKPSVHRMRKPVPQNSRSPFTATPRACHRALVDTAHS